MLSLAASFDENALPADLAEEAPPPPRRERRGAKRIRTVFRVARVVRDRAVGLWRVRNISDQGLMMLTGVPVRDGERIEVDLSDKVSVAGRVVWTDGERCGIEFDAPINSARLLKSLVADQRDPAHRPLRIAVDIKAAAFCERGLHPIRITDLSQHGIGFTHGGCFKAGMQTMVVLENGIERRGVVRWSEDGHAGIMLIEPLSCADLECACPAEVA